MSELIFMFCEIDDFCKWFEPFISSACFRWFCQLDNIDMVMACKIDYSAHGYLFQQALGHGIIMASNGHEGLEAIRKGSYDVILCDVRMPGLDGPGLYRELEQHYPHLLSRMIFLTGDVLSPEARDFFEQVDCLRLIKPFRAREVRQLIQQMLAAQ